MSAKAYFIDVKILMYASGTDYANRAARVLVMTALVRGTLS